MESEQHRAGAAGGVERLEAGRAHRPGRQRERRSREPHRLAAVGADHLRRRTHAGARHTAAQHRGSQPAFALGGGDGGHGGEAVAVGDQHAGLHVLRPDDSHGEHVQPHRGGDLGSGVHSGPGIGSWVIHPAARGHRSPSHGQRGAADPGRHPVEVGCGQVGDQREEHQQRTRDRHHQRQRDCHPGGASGVAEGAPRGEQSRQRPGGHDTARGDRADHERQGRRESGHQQGSGGHQHRCPHHRRSRQAGQDAGEQDRAEREGDQPPAPYRPRDRAPLDPQRRGGQQPQPGQARHQGDDREQHQQRYADPPVDRHIGGPDPGPHGGKGSQQRHDQQRQRHADHRAPGGEQTVLEGGGQLGGAVGEADQAEGGQTLLAPGAAERGQQRDQREQG